ncbi:MAG TPA: hypothetical protein P5294_09725 [Smithellaceae bacterium]|nr:hypothetical protein [Smithellaceae bacterium]HRS90113.1 hypothetical protein [Smithellaceae bacterium]HRV26809.1 hypothetical protein [Smithellaceae bacterium]
MSDKGTKKKLTKVDGGDSSSSAPTKPFVATDESKAKARNLRIIAAVCWLVAIGFQVGAIYLLFKPPIVMWQIIALIVADLIFVIAGSLLWKKSNRFDPPSEKNKIMFFMQSQLGLIAAIIAFLPLVILIFLSKNVSGKQKGIIGGIAIAALVIAGVTGIDWNPPSVEQYAEQTAQVEALTGKNSVFWTKAGTRYHLYSDCWRINTKRTDEIFQGTVAQARELKNITELCSTCEDRVVKEKGLDKGKIAEAVKEAVEKKE